jgi:hypothetical protein
MDTGNLQGVLLRELSLLLEPFGEVRQDPGRIPALLAQLGWDANRLLGPDSAPFVASMNAIAESVTSIRAWVETPPSTLPELKRALEVVAAVTQAVRELPGAVRGIRPVGLEDLPLELLDFLCQQYLAARAPLLDRLLQVLGLIDEKAVAGAAARSATTLPRLRWDRLGPFLTDPLAEVKRALQLEGGGWRNPEREMVQLLFREVSSLLQGSGASLHLGEEAIAISTRVSAGPGVVMSAPPVVLLSWETPGVSGAPKGRDWKSARSKSARG